MTMTTVFLILIALVVVVATLAALARDGYHRMPNAPILRNQDEPGWH